MNETAPALSTFAQHMVIECAGLLVPSSVRKDWLNKWRSELWYVRREAQTSKDAWGFCLGAFSDALWTRRYSPRTRTPFEFGSPVTCITIQALFAGVCFLATFLLPGAHHILVLSVHSDWIRYLKYSWLEVGESPPDPIDQQIVMLREAIISACIVLPAVTSLSLRGGSGVNSLHSYITRSRWAGFFVLKVILILPLVYFFALDLSHIFTSDDAGNLFVQIATLLIGFVLSLRWAFNDQRRRCPTCLRLAGYPVQIGQRSRTLLDWNLTEYMCPKGHGVLHVSEASVDGVHPPQWVSMDSSWR